MFEDRRASWMSDEMQAEDARNLWAARDDLSQFAPVYERYFPRIYAYCLRRVSGAQEAEDLASQVFTRAMAGVHQYRGGSVAAWLFRIAHNCTVNHLRSYRPQVSLEGSEVDVPGDSTEPVERIVRAEEREAIRALVATLPPDQVNLLTLKIVGGLTANEIGEILGKSPVAVRVELHRILKRLRERYAELEGAE